MKEKEMREADVPWPKTMEELTAYIDKLVTQEHDYGTCVYAMSMSALAAMYYVSGKLGVTGFQASCADMDILRRSRNMKGPFKIINYEHAVYPQYADKFEGGFISQDVADWLKEEAQKNLNTKGECHPDVMAHWRSLADGNIPFGMTVRE